MKPRLLWPTGLVRSPAALNSAASVLKICMSALLGFIFKWHGMFFNNWINGWVVIVVETMLPCESDTLLSNDGDVSRAAADAARRTCGHALVWGADNKSAAAAKGNELYWRAAEPSNGVRLGQLIGYFQTIRCLFLAQWQSAVAALRWSSDLGVFNYGMEQWRVSLMQNVVDAEEVRERQNSCEPHSDEQKNGLNLTPHVIASTDQWYFT